MFLRFLKDDSGATAVEYGLLGALIAIAVAGGATTFGEEMAKVFDYVATKMDV